MSTDSARAPYIERVGKSVDCSLNTILLNGDPAETISHHTARARQEGKRWGCIGCRILSALVEHDHCGKVLSNQPEAKSALFRAGLAIAGFLIGADGIAHFAADVVAVLAEHITAFF